MKWFYLFFAGVLLVACQGAGDSDSASDNSRGSASQQSDEANQAQIEGELVSLDTDSKKITYMGQIIRSEMDVREKQSSTLQAHGFESRENKEATRIMEKTGRDNVAKIVGFVEKYGISENQSVGRMQSEAMSLVMSYNSSLETHRMLYSAFHQAWKKEYLEDISFAGYLQDLYQLEHGERLVMKNPYTTADEIGALMKEFNMDSH